MHRVEAEGDRADLPERRRHGLRRRLRRHRRGPDGRRRAEHLALRERERRPRPHPREDADRPRRRPVRRRVRVHAGDRHRRSRPRRAMARDPRRARRARHRRGPRHPDPARRRRRRLAKNGYRLHWGPGRHGPGHNLFTYHRDPDGHVIELFTQIDVVHDESKGYWEPRPWHEEYPMYPKTWQVDLATVNQWAPSTRRHSTTEVGPQPLPWVKDRDSAPRCGPGCLRSRSSTRCRSSRSRSARSWVKPLRTTMRRAVMSSRCSGKV